VAEKFSAAVSLSLEQQHIRERRKKNRDSVGIRKAELGMNKLKQSVSYEHCRSNIMGFFYQIEFHEVLDSGPKSVRKKA